MREVNVRIPESIFDIFSAIAADKRTTTNQQVVVALKAYLIGVDLGIRPEVSPIIYLTKVRENS